MTHLPKTGRLRLRPGTEEPGANEGQWATVGGRNQPAPARQGAFWKVAAVLQPPSSPGLPRAP
eukprot:5016114-Lingulodinium_polyedra.AAC.1